ncbi:hypothetical protein NLI96_g12186 [Meripilus lineatus]|uniref:Uncharacterized protein n=1 Tax=Meripilus lineatus TaxID=2056292 RepID=A0AAD5UV33_9APHY|nr:hypothetical protein NLI96_g12186 [Physisporinus lineatus]
MRAAGFVPLAHTLTPMTHSRHQSASSIISIGDSVSPGTPSSIPTPSEPPPFPPLMFVNPSVVTTTPMWEYQRALGWGGPGRQTMGLTMNPSDTNVSATTGPSFVPPPTPSSRPNPLHTNSSSTVATLASTSTSGSGGFSSSSGSSSWSSVPSLRTRALEKAGGNASEYRYSTPPVDGYPFPHTPPRSQSDSPLSRDESARSSGYSSERESSITASPRSSAESTASNCTIPTPNTSLSTSTMTPPSFSAHIRRSSTAPIPQARPKPTPVQPSSKYKPEGDTPTFATARKRGTRSAARTHELSLTELCDYSPSAWATNPDCLGPLNSSPSSGPSGNSSGSSSVGSGRVSQGRSRASSANIETGSQRRGRERGRNEDRDRIKPKHRGPPVVAEVQTSPAQQKETTEMATTEVRAPPETWDPVKEGNTSGESDKLSVDGDKPRSKAKAKERERQSSSSSRHSHGHGGHKGYSSFSFPPTSSPESKTAPHVLGEREKSHSSSKETKPNSKERRELREKEHHHRGKELGALVQAHRDRDREQARQSEREHRDALEHAKEKAIAIDSEVNTEAEVDVVHDLDQDWDRLRMKRIGRGRGLHYGSARTRGGRSIFGGSDGDTVVDIF